MDSSGIACQSRRVPPRDPRFRPYRIALWVVYFGFIVVAIGLMSWSISRSLRGPPRPSRAAGPIPTRAALRVCLSDLELLFKEQNHRAWMLGSEQELPDPFGRWDEWSQAWERKLSDLSDRCGLDTTSGPDAAARAELAAVRNALLALHRAYAAQVNRFAKEQGELVQAAAEALGHARENVGGRARAR